MRQTDFSEGFRRSMEGGQGNARVLPEARGWCKHLEVEPHINGLYAEMSGLPNSVSLRCQYADTGIEAFNLERSFDSFLEENCENCLHHVDGANPLPAKARLGRIQALRERNVTMRAREEQETRQWCSSRKAALEEDLSLAKVRASPNTREVVHCLVELVETEGEEKATRSAVEAARLDPVSFNETCVRFLVDASREGPIRPTARTILVELANQREDVARATIPVAQEMILAGKGPWHAAEMLMAARTHGIEVDLPNEVYKALIDLQDYSWERRLLNSPPDYSAANKLIASWCVASPDSAVSHFRTRLRDPDPTKRHNICMVLTQILPVGRIVIEHLLPDIIESLELPDSLGAEGRTSTQNLLASAFRLSPDSTLQNITAAFRYGSSEKQIDIVKVFSRIFHEARFPGEEDRTSEETLDRALTWCLDALWRSDAHLEARAEAAQVLQEAADSIPAIAVGHLDSLLGAVVMLADQEKPDRTMPIRIVTPNTYRVDYEETTPSEFFVLHSWDRLKSNLQRAAGKLAHTLPSEALREVSDVYLSLDAESQPDAKASLIRIVGNIARDDQMKSACVHIIWDALMRFEKNAQVLRAAALDALTSGFSSQGDLLPAEMLEMICRALGDPFVIVHMSAVRCIGRIGLRDDDPRRLATFFLLQLLETYRHRRDEVSKLERIGLALLIVSAGESHLKKLAIRAILETLPTGEALVDWRLLEEIWHMAESNDDMVVVILKSSLPFIEKYPMSPHGGSAAQLPEMFLRLLAETPVEYLRKIAPLLLKSADTVADQAPHLSTRIAERLSIGGLAGEAAQILDNLYKKLPHGRKISPSGQLILCTATVEHMNAAITAGSQSDTSSWYQKLTDSVEVLSQCDEAHKNDRFNSLYAIRLFHVVARYQIRDLFSLLDRANELKSAFQELVPVSGEGLSWAIWRATLHAVGYLCTLVEYAIAAETEAIGHDLQHLKTKLQSECFALRRILSGTTFAPAYQTPFSALLDLAGGNELPEISKWSSALSVLLIPPLYEPLPNGMRTTSLHPTETEIELQVVKLRIEIDGKPWPEVQFLHPNQLYNLTFSGEVTAWPKEISVFAVRLIHTLPPGVLSLSLPEGTPDPNGTQFSLRGSLLFTCNQAVLSDPISLKIQFLIEKNDKEARSLRILGMDELKVHLLGPITAVQNVSSKIAATLRKIWASECGGVTSGLEDEFNEIFEQLYVLGSFQLHCYQRASFDKTAKEIDLQRGLLTYLDARYPGEVLEHTSEAGGVTDVVFRRLRIELKVESETSERSSIVEKYSKQVAQYSSGSYRLMSALVVLDLTPKRGAPPAHPRNDIFLVDVTAHGYNDDQQYPSKVWLFIVNGNLERPSDYSH